jgi:hypothetical protein
MKYLIPLLLLCSCKSTTIKHTWPDKSVTELSDHRLMYKQDASFTFSNAGTVITLTINSNPDSNAVQAAAEGAAYGAVKGIKGTP